VTFDIGVDPLSQCLVEAALSRCLKAGLRIAWRAHGRGWNRVLRVRSRRPEHLAQARRAAEAVLIHAALYAA
jgi:hypothetical protein